MSNVHCRQVDVYSQLLAHTAEQDRLKISRRVLRKLLRIRDIARLSFRWAVAEEEHSDSRYDEGSQKICAA